MTLSGNTLYGMTGAGGDSNKGTIFSIETNGTGFTVLHDFTGGANDGHYPFGDLTLSEDILYGTTSYGGVDSALGMGTIFSVGTDGTGFTLLHEFAGGAADGKYPRGSLTLSENILYGMTYNGGGDDLGTVFSYSLDQGGGDVPEPSTLLMLLPFIGFGLKKLKGKKA